MASPTRAEISDSAVPSRKAAARRRTLIGWLFILPTVVVFGVFTIYPIILGIPLAFFNVSLQLEPTFVGLTHFERLWNDANFWNAMKNSLLYLAVVPPLQFLSITLAVLLNQKLPGTAVFRVMYYIPVVTSMVAVAITWKWLYQDRGLINSFLATIGVIHPLDPIGLMTRGGPIDSTMVANAYLYRTGFEQLDFGYAAAVGLALGVVVLTASIGVFIFNRRGGLNYY